MFIKRRCCKWSRSIQAKYERRTSCRASPSNPHGAKLLPSIPETLSVLFVDDDAVLRKLFVRSLRMVCPGWKITKASSGERALELFRNPENEFDLVFIDQYMASNEPNPILLVTEAVCVREELLARCADYPPTTWSVSSRRPGRTTSC